MSYVSTTRGNLLKESLDTFFKKKEKSFWDELPDKSTLKAFGKGLLELPKNLAFEIPQSYYETFTTSPYGYKMGDYNLNTDDPNHQEYKKVHLNFWKMNNKKYHKYSQYG